MNYEHSQTDKTVILKRLGEPEGHAAGQPKGFVVLYKYRKFRGNGGFLPGETCEPLVVRGTTSFYNNKLQSFAY